MSRIGNNPIQLPQEVTINITPTNTVEVKGPKGNLLQKIDPDIRLQVQEQQVTLSRPTEQKRHKALHGLYRTLIQNMIIGVTQGYKKSLELVGVGYKANVQNNVLELHLGYAHPIHFVLPPEIKTTTEKARGKNSTIHIESNDKQLLGQVCAKIRSLRKPEPYKGKGIRFVGEQIRRKAGKTASK